MASVYSTMVMFELIWKWAREFAGVHCWYIEGWGCGPARKKKKRYCLIRCYSAALLSYSIKYKEYD